jgi:parallel beta-helix repeat protein
MKVLAIKYKKFQAKRLAKMMGFLLVLMLINLSFLTMDYENDINNDFSNEIDKNLKISGISEKIHINNNWSDAKAAGICTGSGTYTDPYVIKDLIIDAEELGSCILIENSNDYFKIDNCTVQNSEGYSYFQPEKRGAGIKLINAHNGTICNNNFSLNQNCGIYLEESNNNTIKENFAHQEGGNRLYLAHNCSNNKIINNTLINNDIILSGMNNNLSENKLYEAGINLNGNITECASHIIDSSNKVNGIPIYYYANEIGLEPINFTGAGQIILVNTSKSLISDLEIFNSSTGISLYYSHDNSIQKNNFSFNRNGIYLGNSYNNIITENNLNNNQGGLLLYLNCDNNTITMNNLTQNGTGIYFQECDNNSILRNNISNNDGDGIICYSSTLNNFSYNIINFNGEEGIYYKNSHNGTFMNNILNSNKERGIVIYQSDSNLILQNSINNCEFSGIYLSGRNNNLSGNLMFHCGLSFSSYLIEDQFIDTTNKVNDKILYYYVNKNGLTPSNFSNAGQIILSNCNDSLISDIDVSYGTCGILLSLSNNNTIKNCNSSFNTHGGIYLGQSHRNIIIDNDVNNNTKGGIILDFSTSNKIQNNNVSYTKKYFSSGSGITLGNMCDNNSIIGNNLNYNDRHGIEMSWCEKNNLSNNNMMGCGLGIAGSYDDISSHFIDTTNKVNEKSLYYYINKQNLNSNDFTNAGQVILFNCNNSLISEIDVSHGSNGITLFSCINITISSINSSFNSDRGVYLSGCYNCSILKNVITNNWYSGIYMSSSDNNIIKENDISSNHFGIYFTLNDFCIISGNSLRYNTIYGISVHGPSNNNTFYFNKFIGNGLHAEDWGYDNNWDNGIIGNYWDNYTGIDENNDGIGDTPYFILRDSYDNFPILDITIPDITIHKPINEEIYGFNPPEFNVEIKDPHLDKMWYTINNSATNIFFTLNGTINQVLWDTLTEGNVIIRFYANDSIGNIGFQEITIIKATPQPIPPEIPGYDILLLVGIISAVAIIIKKKVNHLK